MPTKKNTTENKWVDPDDAPHLDRGWFERAELREGDHVIRPAPAVGRPKQEVTKNAVNIRLDADVVAYFRAPDASVCYYALRSAITCFRMLLLPAKFGTISRDSVRLLVIEI